MTLFLHIMSFPSGEIPKKVMLFLPAVFCEGLDDAERLLLIPENLNSSLQTCHVASDVWRQMPSVSI